ncbi:Iron dependent repressor [Candidatus Sulfobium mesophilum]|uniref:Iron dependent repressor n=1 Tax=Candidatus Sulfobium mesophilum TaxID=2016548 RepID=A0A2U3QFI7_9BACT|nr:Iron dependent repressor [Candidatus Sulfobium mesophilum]
MASITDRERIDEALELIWVLEEEGHRDIERFNRSSDDADVTVLLETLTDEGLVKITNGLIHFTEEGRKKAKGLVRRQRLAERLFTDVFEMPEKTVLDDACKMEHILSEELTESVCIFLGHPPTCPHGKPIPRGECCKKLKVEVTPLVTRLSEFEVGASGKITFIVPSDPSRLSKLNSLGISAGSVIKFIQKVPSCVLQIDETTVAIDPEIAKEIYLKKVVK